jgi:O-succinylbenzoic acid--CoA ligase
MSNPTDGRSPTTLVLAAGPAGVLELAAALRRVLCDGGPSVALVPGYAPRAVAALTRRCVTPDSSSGLPEDLAVICPTSGSTGAPRGVLLTAGNLRAASRLGDERLGGAAAWFVALPPTSAGALIAVTRSVLGPLPATAWTGVGGSSRFTAAEVLAELAAFVDRVTAAGVAARISLVPTQLARLLDHPAGADGLARLDAVLVGGGPLSAGLADRARTSGVPLVRSYGMTETTGGCVFDGLPLDQVRVSISSDAQIRVAGPTVAAGYLHSSTRSGMTFNGDSVLTGDRGAFANGRLAVFGRIDDVVTVRGSNVDRGAVESLLGDSEGLTEVAVVAVEHAFDGARLVAFTVGDARPGDLRARVADQLGPAAVPTIVAVDSLPRLPGGKVDLPSLEAEARLQLQRERGK